MSHPNSPSKKPHRSHNNPVIISSPQSPSAMGNAYRDDLYEEPELKQDLYVDPMDENVDQRVHLAQERLVMLRKEAEQIEREKQLLEELRRKQQEFLQGRSEMMERLSRAVAQLDRETLDSRRKVEQMLVMRDTFAENLESVNSLTPEDWSRADLQIELSRALAVIQDAKQEYDRNVTRLQALTQAAAPVPVGAPVPAAGPAGVLPLEISKETFRRWAFAGLAFTAPALAAGLLTALLMVIFR